MEAINLARLAKIRQITDLQLALLRYCASEVELLPVAQMAAELRTHLGVVYGAAMDLAEQNKQLRATIAGDPAGAELLPYLPPAV
jgi:hypothetical protein